MPTNLFMLLAEGLIARGADMEDVARELAIAFIKVTFDAGEDSKSEFIRFHDEGTV